MNAPPPNNDQSSSALIWVLVGCAGLMVVGLCAATGIGVYLLAPSDEFVSYPDPIPPPPDPTPSPFPGPGPQIPAPPAPSEPPRMVSATVTAVTGSPGVVAGTVCRFPIERQPRGSGYWCRTAVRCGDVTLYGGGATNGYFPCTLDEGPRRDVVGADDETTGQDTDASIRIDTRAGELEIRDDRQGRVGAFTVRARVTEVR